MRGSAATLHFQCTSINTTIGKEVYIRCMNKYRLLIINQTLVYSNNFSYL
nr:MAG TPA: hypothetical protein [Caudoviricetes sp.]